MLIGHRLAVFSGVLGSFNIRAKTVSLFNYSPVSYSAAPQLQPFAAFFGGGSAHWYRLLIGGKQPANQRNSALSWHSEIRPFLGNSIPFLASSCPLRATSRNHIIFWMLTNSQGHVDLYQKLYIKMTHKKGALQW